MSTNCSNCYNGCTEIVSDRCIRYTGIDVPVLGIQNGDSLSYVEQALITFLTSTLDGSGIVITIPQASYCEIVTKYLPTCGDITATVLFEALIKSACDLQTQIVALSLEVDSIQAEVDVIEANYDVSCLTGVSAISGTHAILQATIDAFCAFVLDVETNYVLLADLNTLIQAYIDSLTPTTQYNARMVPYSVVPYFGSNGNFDNTGAGLLANGFDKIYLCNGNNGTPDLRGRVLVTAINGMFGGGLSPTVDPTVNPAFNPNYTLGTNNIGSNSVVLNISQTPAHTHVATAVVTPSSHDHFVFNNDSVASGAPIVSATNYTARALTSAGDLSYAASASTTVPTLGKTSPTTISVGVTNASQGGGGAHDNKQPVYACYYIMYIP